MGRSATPMEWKHMLSQDQTSPVELTKRDATGSFAEHHYTLSEIAAMWSLSHDFVRRLFQKEPGVLIMGREEGNGGRRRYATYRIPASVVERVHRRMSKIR